MAKAKKPTGISVPSADMSLSLAERRKLSQTALFSALHDKYPNTIGKCSDVFSAHKSVPRISSGIFILDYALGGGWPRGRINVVWGDRSASKTTNMLKMIAHAQKMDAITNKYMWDLTEEEQKSAVPMSVAYIDVEGAFDPSWATAHGVDINALTYVRPEFAEEAAEAVEALFKSGSYDVVVIDSLAAMVPKAEAEGEMCEHNVGTAARINSKMFRKVQGALNNISKSDIRLAPTFFVINQLRQKIGVMFGDPSVKPGGVAQDFYGSVEVRLYGNKVAYFDGDERKLPKWSEFSFKVLKNKVSPPKIEGDFKMALVDSGDEEWAAGDILDQKEVVEFCEKLGELKKDGAKWVFNEESFKTKGEFYDHYIKDPQRYLSLKRMLLEKLCPKQ